MAGIFQQYQIVTWSSTKPNLTMEDGGNIWIVQDSHVIFYQTKPEDGGWREYLNCTRLPRGLLPNQTWRWRMAGMVELYKIVTWSSTKPNLKMGDGGNSWPVQDYHVVFYQTKHEDRGLWEYLNSTGLSRGLLPNQTWRWRMAGIFELYKIATRFTTKPNLKMEDGGNIWTVQDCHMNLLLNRTWRWRMAVIFE